MFSQSQSTAVDQWNKLSLVEQMANIGSEVSRASKWQAKDRNTFDGAVSRALELFDRTLADARWKKRLREIARARELFCDAIFGQNAYGTSLDDLNKYFLYFAIAARLHR